MKTIKKTIAIVLSLCLLLAGCSNTTTQVEDISATVVEDTSTSQPDTSSATELNNTETVIDNITLITEVFGDGQKPSAIAIEYSSEIDSTSLSTDDFQVEGQTISAVYANNIAEKTTERTTGNFVIVEFAYANSSDPNATMGGGGGGGTGGGGMQGGVAGEDAVAEPLSVSVLQVGDVSSTDGTVAAPTTTTVSNDNIVNLVVEDFQQLSYTDPETGKTIPYNLYLPEGYDASKTYPLVFFVGDASVNSNIITAPLTQGNGATVWATDESQAKQEAIVLAPQYTQDLIDDIGAATEDDYQWTTGLTLLTNVLNSVVDEYAVDKTRIYGTGQSQGCMTMIAISDKYPDLFAAQYLVAGQWDVEEMSVMKDDKLWITVSEGDIKAYPEMNEAVANWELLGADVATSELWDSTGSSEDLAMLVDATIAQSKTINYTVFAGGNHTYTWTVAYNLEGVRDWIFAQSK